MLSLAREVEAAKEKNLIEIETPNRFKKLLKEDLYQHLRNFGIVEDEAFEVIMNLLLAKAYDELRLADKPEEEPDFQVRPEDYLRPSDFYKRIKDLLFEAYTDLLQEDAKTASEKEILKHKEREKVLLEVVPYLQRLKLRSLRFLGEDSVGDVFLDFLHSIFRQSRGLFFTHPNICRFVCKALGIGRIRDDVIKKQSYKYILDPSCGSGTFLIEALRLLFRNCDIKSVRKLASKVLYGIDNDSRVVALCKVNMVIHGDGSGNIYEGDALEPLANLPLPFLKSENIERFDEGVTKEALKAGSGVDFIVTNPPFSLRRKLVDCEHFRMKDFVPFRNNTTTASECLFAERWFQLLNPKGRLGAVLPYALFDSKEYLMARLLFLCYFRIVAVVGLPEHAFSPHAQQKTLLVFAERRGIEESNKLYKILRGSGEEELIKEIGKEEVAFFTAENIGYKRQKKQKTVLTEETDKNDLTDKLAETIADAFEGRLSDYTGIVVRNLRDLWQKRDLNLTPPERIVKPSGKTLTLGKIGWKVADIEKIEDKELKNLDIRDLLLCETGDIVPGGAGIIMPKKLSATTSSNRERILKKIKNGKFGRLKEGDVIIAPVRVYQGKIAVVLGKASDFLFSKDFIVLRKEDITDPLEPLLVFKVLTEKENLDRLMELSSTGKSGYPKIKDKEKILEIEFSMPEFRKEELKELKELYETIYGKIFHIDAKR